MAKLKLSSKMHIMIIVTAIVVAIGLALGLVSQFVLNGYFNYGAENASYYGVSVDFASLDYTDSADVKEICDNAFGNAGVSYYSAGYGDTTEGGEWSFRFTESADATKIQAAVKAINDVIDGENSSSLSYANFHKVQTEVGGAPVLKYGAIALAAAVAFQFIYFVIRYKLAMAFSALLANVHNLAIYTSLLAITRVPLGTVAVVFGALTVLMTMIGCCYLFDRVRKNMKDEKFAKVDGNELVDISAGESLQSIALISVFVTAAALITFVLLAISSLSVLTIMTPVILAVLSAVSSIYGTAFFTPAVYSRFKVIGDNFKQSHFKKADKKS